MSCMHGAGPSQTNVVDAMCGLSGCVARMSDGTAVAWGDRSYGGNADNVDLTNVVDEMCGQNACAQKTDETAVVWGYHACE